VGGVKGDGNSGGGQGEDGGGEGRESEVGGTGVWAGE